MNKITVTSVPQTEVRLEIDPRLIKSILKAYSYMGDDETTIQSDKVRFYLGVAVKILGIDKNNIVSWTEWDEVTVEAMDEEYERDSE
jgi:hypothetical protein